MIEHGFIDQIEKGLDECHIPEHCREGLYHYFIEGIPTGGFLGAVLENDLMLAFGKADHINEKAIRNYCSFLHNYAPHGSYGSPGNVQNWLKNHPARTAEMDRS